MIQPPRAAGGVRFSGDLLKRGFWLYAWEVVTPKGRKLYYVGRTGDSLSLKAQSPFNRMSQHLGSAPNSSMLRNHLRRRRAPRLACRYRLVAYGPLFDQAKTKDTHRERRDVVAGLEKALADTMKGVGYAVMNKVQCQKPLDAGRFEQVISFFAGELE